MPRIPDKDGFTRQWRQVAPPDRRRIVKAVNRGEVLESRKEAALAVVLARRQQRFWRWAWLAGPVVSVPLAGLFDLQGPAQLGGYALLGAAILLAMGTWYGRRASRAEVGNEARAVHGRRGGT